MVGSLIALGESRIAEKDITYMFEVPSHYNWNPRITPVPPSGLHLVNLEYDQEELKRCTISEEQYQKMRLEEQNYKVQSEEQDRHLLSKKQELEELQLKE